MLRQYARTDSSPGFHFGFITASQSAAIIWGVDISIPPVIRSNFTRRLFSVLKLGSICALILLLFVPLTLTRGVLEERQAYRAQASEEIAGTWGRRQVVTGPVLAVPYIYRAHVTRTRVVDGRVAQVDEVDEVAATAFFLPEALSVSGVVEPEVRRRGIYDVIVYSASLKLAGNFQPDFAAAGVAADRIDWEKAQLFFGISDLRGIRSVGPVAINGGRGIAFEATDASRFDILPLAAKIPSAAAGARLEFAMDATLQGSDRLDFVPVGKSTSVEIRSPWADPSFGGAYLPVRRAVAAEGFSATWEVSHFSRGFAQSWSNRVVDPRETIKKIGETNFGVEFSRLVDGYRLVERAQKYGILFFILVFTVFFLFEIGAGLRIHPVQYALVGAALCLFFLGFLALSEFWSTGVAYAAAAAACTAMISLYALSFLRTGSRTLVIGGSLALTYGGLYFVLKSQDYALVAGTAALFVGLALVMYFTRRLNWNDIEARPIPEPAA